MTNDTINIMDPNILLSVINTKLRDEYSSFALLCDDMDLSENIIMGKLNSIGYYYDKSQNSFK